MRALAGLLLLALAGCGGRAPLPPAEVLRFEAVPASGGARAAMLATGDRLTRLLGCRGCHGDDLTGRNWELPAEIGVLWTSNLTRALPTYSDAELERAIRAGRRPDGSVLWIMPSQIFTRLSAPDMAALIFYLRTVPPAGPARPRIVILRRGSEMIARGEVQNAAELARLHRNDGPPDVGGQHEWARYMIRATCSECHQLNLAGDPPGADEERAPDLIVAGAYSRAAFHHLLRTGAPIGGRRLGLMGEVARSRFSHFTDREIDTIFDYLQARANAPQRPAPARHPSG